jgi:hypothetical protein
MDNSDISISFFGVMQELFEEIVAVSATSCPDGEIIGYTRKRKPLFAYRFGHGRFLVSLIAGCHADEPVGPRLLNHLVGYLARLSDQSPLLERFQWWIVPHTNPDGEEENRKWYEGQDEAIDLVQYLTHFKRELPGDDMEFGFPRDEGDIEARPENRGIFRWWKKADRSFRLHVSLHGIAFAAGPWFLIEPAWASHCQELKTMCRQAVREGGYRLHDVDRQGEKGFRRLEEGFCTRPDWQAMARYFLDLKDELTAGKFRPSSMEAIRALGGDPLTLVTEIPLFILPRVGETLGPPDPEALRWKARIERWKAGISQGQQVDELIRREAAEHGLRAMPIRDQMQLQWTLIAAGVRQVSLKAS